MVATSFGGYFKGVAQSLLDAASTPFLAAAGWVSGRPYYTLGKQSRYNPAQMSGDAAIAETRDSVLARVRHASENSPIIQRCSTIITQMAIGTGVQAYSAANNPNDKRYDLFAQESDEAFLRWAVDECDAVGDLTFWEMQAQSFKDMTNAGASLWLMCYDDSPNRTLPLCFQILEREQLDTSKDRHATDERNKIVGGVEYDRFTGRVAGYWLFDAHPYDLRHGMSVRGPQSAFVPADRVIREFIPTRPSANDGIPWWHGLVSYAQGAELFTEGGLQQSINDGMLTAFVTGVAKSGINQLGAPANSNSTTPQMRLGHSTVVAIDNQNAKVTKIQSDLPGPNVKEFTEWLMVLESVGANISKARLFADSGNINFSAGLISQANDHAFCLPLQQFVGHRVVVPIRRKVEVLAANLGLFTTFTPREYRARRLELSKYDVIGPGMPMLKPGEETDAAIKRIRSGLSTFRDECGRRGMYWRAIFRQRVIENEFADDIGFEVDLSDQQGAAKDVMGKGGADDEVDMQPASAPAPSQPARRRAA